MPDFVGSSRIWIDIREEGQTFSAHLQRLGFIVEEFLPYRFPSGKRELELLSARRFALEDLNTTRRVLLSDDSPLWLKTHQSLVETNSQPECAEVVRLWKMWKRCPLCSQGGKCDIHISR
jgi:hypothetical protein